MSEAGQQDVETYVSLRQNMITQFIATRPIMDICLVVEQIPGPRVYKQCWGKYGVDVEGMRTAAWELERTEGGRTQTGQRQIQNKSVGGQRRKNNLGDRA